MRDIKLLAVLLAAFLPASVAYAGASTPFPVLVLPVDGSGFVSANGDMLTARNDPNVNVYIGCGVRHFNFPGGTPFVFGFCQAVDAQGNVAFCNTDDPFLLDAIRSSSSFSFVTFSYDNATGLCARIGFSTQSFYLPDFKNKEK